MPKFSVEFFGFKSLKERSSSEDTAELSEGDADEVAVKVKVNFEITDLGARYEAAVRAAIKGIKRVSGPYELAPILIANDVDISVLETVSSSVSGFHVRSHLLNGKWFITNLSTGYPQAEVFDQSWHRHSPGNLTADLHHFVMQTLDSAELHQVPRN